ncbi:MAG: twin transmembrane helix small protein [Rhodobacteraceae bacterium]|nr:MAG: twin transmembrane helix small protein [Paracoccaceae bacterium]
MSMENLYIVPVISCLVVLVILMIGITVFAKGGAVNRKYSNKLMRYRVIAQAIAVLIILGYVLIQQRGI